MAEPRVLLLHDSEDVALRVYAVVVGEIVRIEQGAAAIVVPLNAWGRFTDACERLYAGGAPPLSRPPNGAK